MKPENHLYKTAGVDIAEAQSGRSRIIDSIKQTWPPPGGVGAVKLDIGYFANVIDIGGIGLAMCTDGVGSKSIIAQMMRRYDTIGIDCVAMNVNDVICVGARPLSMVDYIAIEKAHAEILGAIAIAIGLTAGAKQAGVSISGGEISQLKDVISGFDLIGMAVGIVSLDHIITGRDLVPGDVIIGLESSGIHSNGLTLARRVFFERAKLSIDHVFPELGVALGQELLRPTLIYVPEILDVIKCVPTVKALINITGDGLLNLPRADAKVGFEIDNLPSTPPIFRLIQQCGAVRKAEMFEVYNMGVGFCVLVSKKDCDAVLSTMQTYGRKARIIGRVIEDDSKGVYLPGERLAGHGKEFREH
jgi:phosphoribosylformylglycinamidine cyclo-ligase